jgi:glycolate oxidase FAD binding subunit
MGLEARPPRGGEEICGVVPGSVFEPASVEEAVTVLVELARAGASVACVGGGTALALGFPPRRVDALLRTGRLDRIVEYVPSDLVITAEAGVTLAALQREVGAHGQRLALDPPQPERATLGGLVATAAFGPRRARYGALRDLLLGVTLVRADGEVTRSGGKVVKNVAGFDVQKVVCGSLGSLGLIARVTLRLHPLPEASESVVFPRLSGAGVWAIERGLKAAQLEPAASVASYSAGAFDLGVLFEGFAAAVSEQVARLRERARELRVELVTLDAGAAAQFWQQHEALRTRAGVRVRIAALPSHVAELERTLAPLLAALVSPGLAWYSSLGLGFVGGETQDPQALLAPLAAVREALVRGGGSLVVEAAPAELAAHLDPWGPAPGGMGIMHALKSRFDPEGRMNPGRFSGRL